MAKPTDYYDQTASRYDEMQLIRGDEHSFGLSYLEGILKNEGAISLLDVGCGTGRVLAHLRDTSPGLHLHGIEPSAAMLEQCVRKGLDGTSLTQGDACHLPFEDGAFDIVTAFGVLHHIKEPQRAISEMIRTSKKAVIISDHNVYGWGSWSSRVVKNSLRVFGLWPFFCRIHTLGRGYYDTDYDGIFFPFSILDHSKSFCARFERVNFLTTKSYGPSLYFGCSHVVLYASAKRRS